MKDGSARLTVLRQASTLVIRAMAVGEVTLDQWWRVIRREISAGLVLGALLGLIGMSRILLWQAAAKPYGEHYMLVALTVACSLVGVVLFGTMAGSMLPFVLRRLGVDPASASAPFVATLVDVTGLVIYFTVASLILRGTLL
jgi:magnesium transporter